MLKLRGHALELQLNQVTARDRLFQFMGCAERDDAAVVHDGKPVTKSIRLLHVMSRQKDRLSARVVFTHHVPQKQARLRIKARARLVEEQDLGIMHHRASDRQPLQHAA